MESNQNVESKEESVECNIGIPTH